MYITLQQGQLVKLGFSASPMLVKHFCIILLKFKSYLLLNISLKRLSSSLDALLKLSKTTSSQKLFDYDYEYITLYNGTELSEVNYSFIVIIIIIILIIVILQKHFQMKPSFQSNNSKKTDFFVPKF